MGLLSPSYFIKLQTLCINEAWWITCKNVPAPRPLLAHEDSGCVIPSSAFSHAYDWLYSDSALQTDPIFESATFCQPDTETKILSLVRK